MIDLRVRNSQKLQMVLKSIKNVSKSMILNRSPLHKYIGTL